jgi:DNA replication protein DnaC
MINNISQACIELNMPGILESYQSIADECGKLKASYSEYLEQILKYELSAREQRSKEMVLKMAHLPILKTLEMFDFSSSNVNKMQVQELSNLQFITNKENVIFIGSPGTGKTHLAISLAYLATQKRMRVKFLTVADLLLQMDVANSQNKLKSYFTSVINQPRLLVLDEFGYLKLNEFQANLLFQIVNKRYETGSIIITSNLTFSQWQGVLNNDEALAAALMDRLIHHSIIININGDSHRLKQKRKAGIIPVNLTKNEG